MKLHAYHYQCPHEAPRMWTLEIPDSRAAVKSNFTIVMKVHTEVFHEDPSQVKIFNDLDFFVVL